MCMREGGWEESALMRPYLWLLGGGGRANFLQGGDHTLVNGLIPIHIRATLRNIAKILKNAKRRHEIEEAHGRGVWEELEGSGVDRIKN